MYVGSFLVTRTIAGWQVGLLEERVFRNNLPVALLVVLGGTILTESCFFLFAPEQHVVRWLVWLIQTLTGALYNTVLAIPLYLLLRRLVRPRKGV
jgi:cell shape-determining protein MreD